MTLYLNYIFLGTTLTSPLLCDYSGKYFCSECHWGSLSIIPARVVLNWDFQQDPVSRVSKQFLKLMTKKPILNLESINPKLFSFVEELALVKVCINCTFFLLVLKNFSWKLKRFRSDIMIMKEYILTCKDALEARLLRLLEDRQHFVENSEYYSIQVAENLIFKNVSIKTLKHTFL